jgi:hypothetical protein
MKRVYESKTIVFNLLTIAIVLATFMGFTPNQELAETTSNVLIALSPLINIALRFLTDKGITLK